jgi:AcrR family transcriptional regulator
MAGPDRREEILQRALELFAARGYDAIGVQEICTAAGVTKPTLYHYFGSKRGLLEALVTERSMPLLAALRDAATYSYLPLNLQRVTETCFRFAQEQAHFYRLLLMLWFNVPESEAFQIIAGLNEQIHQLVEAMFAAAITDHGNMRGRQRVYAASFLGIINTYIGQGLHGYLELNTELVYRLVHQFSHGIYS